MNVQHLNNSFPSYPVTVSDKGWVYGVWYCGTSWQKVSLHGQYPPTFMKRAVALFPDAADILHSPSGTIVAENGDQRHWTTDLIVDRVRKPQVQSNAGIMPFADNSFDLVLSDPPYTAKDSHIYGCDPWPMGAFMAESRRVLRPKGYLGILHTYYPSYKRKNWELVGLIAVVTGFQRATRMFSIFRSTKKWEWDGTVA